MMNRQSQRNPLRRFPARPLRRSTGAEDSRPERPEERPPLRLRRRERSSSDVETLRVWLAQDKAKDPKAQEKRFFRAAKRVERQYGTQLRKIARHVGDLVKALIGDDPFHTEQITAALNQYSETIEPWAASVANRMIAEVNARDYEQWAAISQAIGAGIRETISSPGMVGETWRELQREQVALITSLPREAAQRVQDLASKAMTEGTRAEHLVKDILETGDVTVSRAKTIARTEVSRTKANLTEARAIAAGSSKYRWRTAGDSDVRPSHRALNGKVFRWDDPPECDPGYHANPGCIFNCRCIAIPIFDDEE